MEIDFADSGLRYRYLDVPPDIFAALMAAPSKGTFLNDHIKGRYESLRL
ncbi:MAG: KTSC domain-containing protein [Proteobacteria bacterium]|nr:KTSC domain-containing protein [Pseudomonadota bacterium]